MKTGDEVKIKNRPELGKGRVVRFYANHGTALVKFENPDMSKYCDYCSIEKAEKDK